MVLLQRLYFNEVVSPDIGGDLEWTFPRAGSWCSYQMSKPFKAMCSCESAVWPDASEWQMYCPLGKASCCAAFKLYLLHAASFTKPRQINSKEKARQLARLMSQAQIEPS